MAARGRLVNIFPTGAGATCLRPTPLETPYLSGVPPKGITPQNQQSLKKETAVKIIGDKKAEE